MTRSEGGGGVGPAPVGAGAAASQDRADGHAQLGELGEARRRSRAGRGAREHARGRVIDRGAQLRIPVHFERERPGRGPAPSDAATTTAPCGWARGGVCVVADGAGGTGSSAAPPRGARVSASAATTPAASLGDMVVTVRRAQRSVKWGENAEARSPLNGPLRWYPAVDRASPGRLETPARIRALSSSSRRRVAAAVLLVLATIGSALAVTLGLHLEPNVSSLLPDHGEAAALRRYVRAFGGGDLAVVMVKGPDPEENAAVARAPHGGARRHAPASAGSQITPISRAPSTRCWPGATRIPPPAAASRPRSRRTACAPGSARRARSSSRPGAERSPRWSPGIRCAWRSSPSSGQGSGGGMKTQPDGAFSNDDGDDAPRARAGRGQSLRGADAKAFVADANSVIDPLAREHPARHHRADRRSCHRCGHRDDAHA